jgi:hypothetical protein
MEQYILNVFIDYRGHHRKGIAIYDATEVFLNNTEI